MLARPFMLLSLSAGAVALAMPAALVAQETAAPQVANSPYQFAGEITADNVYVRSGPREGDYATMKLDRGAPVTVVGIKFDWLKILPPEGSFSYVSKAFVQQYGGRALRFAEIKPEMVDLSGGAMRDTRM